MYDPTVGRWMSQDPIGFQAGDANLYRYVGNHPTMATDPSGLAEKQVIPFKVMWGDKQYLVGKLFIEKLDDGCFKINVHLRRLSDESQKAIWNELDSEVPDNWDREAWAEGWLWPHLYGLFNQKTNGKGIRYGGYDPYKKVDNDFAAIVGVPVDKDGKPIRDHSKATDWHAVGGSDTLSHVAGSEAIKVCGTGADKIRIWVFMADSFGYPINNDWPTEGAGSAFGYFELDPVTGKVGQPKIAPKTGLPWE